MFREVLKSKLHRAMITGSDVEYEGSIEIPTDLMKAADLWAGEKVLVASPLGRGWRPMCWQESLALATS